jgi:hypothetical protein
MSYFELQGREIPSELVEKTMKEYLALYVSEYMKDSELSDRHSAAATEYEALGMLPRRLLKKTSIASVPATSQSIEIEGKNSESFLVSFEIVPASREWSEIDSADSDTKLVIREAVSLIVAHAVGYWDSVLAAECEWLRGVRLALKNTNLTLLISDGERVTKAMGPVVTRENK